MTRKPAFAPSDHFDKHEKAIIRNPLFIQIVVIVAKESWLVQENRATVKLDSSVASGGMKSYSESRFELRNPQMLTKILEKNRDSFCHQSSPVNWKARMLPWWILQELKKNLLGKLAVTVNTGGQSIRVLNERIRSVSGGGNLRPLRLEILESLWYSVGDTL